MPISSKTLFHFTGQAENLIGILKDEFKPRFCLEDLTSLRVDGGVPFLEDAVPMVCFCDIPLSMISDHLAFYGNYGIGMTKEWAVRSGINPILYLSAESYLNKFLSRTALTAFQSGDDLLTAMEMFEVFAHTKPIEGKMFRNGDFVDKYFYDEREWRFVPTLVTDPAEHKDVTYRLSKEEFLDDIRRADANRELSTNSTLSFEPSDIKYIIVAKDSEIRSTINAIRRIKGRYDSATVDILASRVISAEQISEDF